LCHHSEIFSVPIFDGREKFQLGSYWEKPYVGEISKGSTVMLLFSVKKGNVATATREAIGMPDNIKFTIYLNILAVIVLAGPAEHFSNRVSQEDPEAFGVNSIADELPEAESEGEDNGDNLEPFL
jgi:hypothetical protein